MRYFTFMEVFVNQKTVNVQEDTEKRWGYVTVLSKCHQEKLTGREWREKIALFNSLPHFL